MKCTWRRNSAIGFVLSAGLAIGVGVGVAAAYQQPRHPTLLTGADWSGFSGRDKQIYLTGFIAGAAAEQVVVAATSRDGAIDSSAASSSAIEQHRAGKTLAFRYSPSVYAAQMDDFYWWQNHASTPIVDVMISLNRQMLTGQSSGAP